VSKIRIGASSLKDGGNLQTQTFGKVMELEDVGAVIEILPNIFVQLTNIARPDSFGPLFYDRFARISFEHSSDRVPINPGVFREARFLLARALGAPDLSPGLDAHSDPVGYAALVAHAVHYEQKDKSGFPYIEHPRRVFLNSEWSLNPEDLSESERVIGYQAAWMHDVIEDSAEFFYRTLEIDDLVAWGFSPRVGSVVQKLTRSGGDDSDANYYRKILLDSTARAVKLADIADNLATWRVEMLPEATRQKLHLKYNKALEALLFQDEDEGGWFGLRLEAFDEGLWPVFAKPESAHHLSRLQNPIGSVALPKPRAAGLETMGAISKIFQEAERIAEERQWQDLRTGADLPYGFALESWYTAVILLLGRTGRFEYESERDFDQDAELLSFLVDGMHRSEASFQFGGFGFVPRTLKSLDVKLSISDAHLLLRQVLNATEASPSESGVLRYQELPDDKASALLMAADTARLLVATTLAFDQRAATWTSKLMKLLVIELDRRARK